MDTLTIKDENTEPGVEKKGGEIQKLEDKKQIQETEETPESASDEEELEKGVFEMEINEDTVEVQQRLSFEMEIIPKITRKPPLSNEVRNLIVHYCTAVQRILEFKTHPLLATFREKVPLRIKLLELSPNSIIVDAYKIEYSSILLHLDGKSLPQDVIDRNKLGYHRFDVNKYGAEVRDNWTPGDVIVRGKYKTPFPGYGKKEPFDVFVRATFQYRGGKKKVQTMTEKISTLMKTLTEEILGGGQSHLVFDLRVSTTGILRLPIGLKLRAMDLSSLEYGLDVLDTIPQIIREDHLPLPSFCTFVSGPKDAVLQHPVFRSTKSIYLFMPKNCQDQNWTVVLKKFKNQHIKLFGHELHFRQFFPIVKDWINNPRPLGSSFSMNMVKFDYAMSAIQKLCGAMEVITSDLPAGNFPTALCIHLNDELELVFYPTFYDNKAPGVHLLMEVGKKGTSIVVSRVSSV
ncbi:hypothetical protein CAEBREN_14322 [Caenorhabditis brenneri]|uniref:Uncharacterized protein n=1 Tax=Caenorhabditis brenneri TaxID=135651 RepID=G0MDR5_CAEBE|nr:hypothetical protein CAEBREN_14322 [Caenorhabditis brenneri]